MAITSSAPDPGVRDHASDHRRLYGSGRRGPIRFSASGTCSGYAENMADRRKRLADNVEGEFFVDSTCIDCDTCRQLAPATFAEGDDFAFVYSQPQTDGDRRAALRALVSCPTASIGAGEGAREVLSDFPLHLEAEVYYCGFASPKSYGGSSYFVRHPVGNWLIDSPRFVEHLARQFEQMGGIRQIFLTHRDDIADAARFAERFASRRIIHRLELSAQPGAEVVLEGTEPARIAPEFLAIPTPGHTRGHTVLLYRDRFLFTGDHLWWSRGCRALNASRSVCWYSWSDQKRSMARLLEYKFEWVLPGHGQRVEQPVSAMHTQLRTLIERMDQER